MSRNTVLGAVLSVLLLAQAGAAADLPPALIEPYLQVQVALSADKFDGVTTNAAAIEKAATALGADARAIADSAKRLAAAADIKAAREAFGDVSTALTEYAEKTKTPLGADVRVAYCPMVKKPWLTKDKTIRNPYYGAAMLTCGNFK
jgi:ABC-type branched-subunit amino acid transport system substrate-binding protein